MQARSLFENAEGENLRSVQPLAARMRPESLDQFVGQRQFLGEGCLLPRLLKADRLGSVIFYGPPGTGKTTLSRLLAKASKKKFVQLSAITSSVKELREVLAVAKDRVAAGDQGTLLFIDEIHRFNKTQQDALLPDVEEGIVTFIGATTQNPFFSVNNALISRSQIFQFEPLTSEDIREVLERAINDTKAGLGRMKIDVEPEAIHFLAEASDGDARRALTALEIAVRSSNEHPIKLTRQLVEESLQKKAGAYDRDGDEHYDVASALIKSIRGSDPDAAIYWLARMLEAGEDIRFICRRLMILASEDIGNADPRAITLSVSCAQMCEMVGLPECQFTLAQTVLYLACAPKSNATTLAIGRARKDIREERIQPVPLHLRDKHYGGAAELGHGEGYQYSHDSPDGIAAQSYLGVEKTYYEPVNRGWEANVQERLKYIRARLRGETPSG